MPTTAVATKVTGRSHTPEIPLLRDQDLDNPIRFLKIPHVPLIDVHDDPIKGNISLDLLKLITKNSNDRVAQGDPIVVTVGHMKRKNTIVVVRPDGSKIILPGTDETNQPPIVGYAKNLTVDRFRDNDWIHGDFYIKTENASAPIENPFRSVERVVPPDDGADDGDDASRHYIDRISLLRTPPEREGGVLHYDRADGIIGCCGTNRKLLKICYSRDPTPIQEPKMPLSDETTPEQDEAVPPVEEEGGGGLPATVGEMSPQDFFEGFAHVLRLVLDETKGDGETPPGDAPEGGGETVPYEKDMSMGKTIKDDDKITKRVPYAERSRVKHEATQAGGSNTFVPGGGKGRLKYERGESTVTTPNGTTSANVKNAITRTQYAKDKGETDEILTYLYGQLSDMQVDKRRVMYGQVLRDLRDQEGVELADEDIATLVNQVGDMTPEGHEDEKLKEIRKYYSRRAVNVPGIPVGAAPFAALNGSMERPANPDEVKRATALRMGSDGKMSYADALATVRGKK